MMNRRRFVRNSVSAATMAAVFGNFPYAAYAAAKPKLASDVVTLGPRKLKLSRLAMGTGTSGFGGSSQQTRSLGVRGLAGLLRSGYDAGVRFWDTADQYGSHPHVREALKGVPREKVVLLTKTHARTAAEMKADLDRYRRELNTDYLDIMLLHCMMSDTWPEERRGAMEYIAEAQEKGLIRTRGVSCHTLGALKAAAKSDWVEVDLARINPAGAVMDADVPTVLAVLKEMKAQGKGVIGMKILGAGQLVAKADECLQYALASDVVDCFTIGSGNLQQFQQLTRQIQAASTRG
ncbi:MAG: aldo/keto reductase [Bryobacterales bacterium]|nr:aldo/keto reductase [Bryobacterales bacterium]